MPKKSKELSATEVRHLRPGTHTVGGVAGLLLVVRASGARSWIYRYATGETRISKKGHPFAVRRDYGLGGFPDLPLKDAREAAREARALIRQGIDPVTQRREAAAALRAANAKRMTFRDAAMQCHAKSEQEFRSAKHKRDWISSLEMHAFPKLGDMEVSEIQIPDVMRVLEPIWKQKTETATRVRQRMEAVLAWATVAGYREGDNAARWSENLDQLLPNPSKIRKVQHHPALPYPQVGQFMQALRRREGSGARALEFAILTAARSREVRGATWAEIDLQEKVWTVPATRAKAGKVHRVPLSDDAISLLESLPERSGYLFTAVRGGAVSDATIGATVKRMHQDEIKAGRAGWVDPKTADNDAEGNPVEGTARRIVPHGFRSTFKDWARNCTRYPDEASELALAHVNSDATRAAYARDELMPMRAKLMQEWAGYCAQPIKAGTVAKMEAAR